MNSPEELLAELKQLKTSLSEPEAKASKPEAYNAGANTSYYNEKCALELREQLDSMSPTKDFLMRCMSCRLKLRSLEAKVYQSWRYLIDHLDTDDGKYAKLRASIQTIKYQRNNKWPNLLKHEEGLILSWVANPSSIVLASPNKLVGETIEALHGGSQRSDWKADLDFFIQNSQEGEKFDRKDLLMTQEEFDATYAKLVTLETFVIHPKSNITHLIVFNSSLLKQL